MHQAPTDALRKALFEDAQTVADQLVRSWLERLALYGEVAFSTPPPEYLTAADIQNRLQISRSTLERWVKEKKFPQPQKIENTLRWRRDDVDRFLAPVPA
jgi:predicted DNA-binding transcriptional regulator AlpA